MYNIKAIDKIFLINQLKLDNHKFIVHLDFAFPTLCTRIMKTRDQTRIQQ